MMALCQEGERPLCPHVSPCFRTAVTRLPHSSRFSTSGHSGPQSLCSLITDNPGLITISLGDAHQIASVLRQWISSLHHHQLLPAKSTVEHAAESGFVPGGHGTGAPALPLRGRWIRGHAGTCALAL